MSLESKTKMWKVKGENKKTMYVQIPAEIVRDSQFPFTVNTKRVKVKIDVENKRLIVEKLNST